MKGEDTLSTVAVFIRGKVREFGCDRIPELFEKNPYMHQIYPTGPHFVPDRAGTLPALWELYDGLSGRSGGKKVRFNVFKDLLS